MVAEPVAEQAAVDASQHIVDRDLVISALRALSAEHRRVLYELYYRGASVAEAAETLRVSAGTVKSRSHHALRALQQAIDAARGAG